MSIMRAEIPDQTQIMELVPALRIFARLHFADIEDADQLVQQTLIKATDKLHLLRPELRPSTWLLAIIYGLSHTGGEKEGQSKGRAEPGMASPGKGWSNRGQAVWHALAQLPLHHREVLVLTDVLGERYEDAAHICNCAVGTIKSRLNRARHHMRRELKQHDGDAVVG